MTPSRPTPPNPETIARAQPTSRGPHFPRAKLARATPERSSLAQPGADPRPHHPPRVSLPCAKIDGLPVGLMLTGRLWEDATVLHAAHAFEQTGRYK